MIFKVFIGLVLVGVLLWALGVYFERPDIGFLGSIFVVGIAASVVVNDGVMVQTGAEHLNTSNGTIVERQYEKIETVSDFPLGLMVLFVGALLGFKSLGEMSEK